MAKGRREIPPCCKTYGLPLYCAACVPVGRISSAVADGGDQVTEPTDIGGEPDSSSPPATKPDQLLLVLGGGGGEGRSGVPNALVLSGFDFTSKTLSDQPMSRLGTDKEVPYRMAMHPGGDGVICSFPQNCRWFAWDLPQSKEPHTLALKSSGKVLTQLEDVGQQLALAFDAEGSILAAGGEDGHLRVFKWPSMQIILDETDAQTSVKDLAFSSDAKYLVSLRSSGPCRVWDLTSSKVVASLPREDGEMFGFCRFCLSNDGNQLVHITAMHGHHGKIISWTSNSWKKLGSKMITRDPISAFSASSDAKLLAIGTIEGDIIIMNSSKLQLLTSVKKAHLGIVTALVFSQDSRALVSTSIDYTARVTLIEKKKNSGFKLWLVILIILLACLIYFMVGKKTL